ncbi:MAG: hypothetical protein L0Z73_05885 [Gammaproteobacteria bacterium]|nr:hypothetical protein [Gammaproteobacteria bacterium]
MKLILILLLFLSGCAHAETQNTLVLDYEEFGPPAAAYKLIGNDWWQWLPHGDSRPKKYDIKVVVFKDIDLDKVQRQFPIIEQNNQDYRYLKYNDALEYLDRNIEEDLLPEVTTKLKTTKQKLVQYFEKH